MKNKKNIESEKQIFSMLGCKSFKNFDLDKIDKLPIFISNLIYKRYKTFKVNHCYLIGSFAYYDIYKINHFVILICSAKHYRYIYRYCVGVL